MVQDDSYWPLSFAFKKVLEDDSKFVVERAL